LSLAKVEAALRAEGSHSWCKRFKETSQMIATDKQICNQKVVYQDDLQCKSMCKLSSKQRILAHKLLSQQLGAQLQLFPPKAATLNDLVLMVCVQVDKDGSGGRDVGVFYFVASGGLLAHGRHPDLHLWSQCEASAPALPSADTADVGTAVVLRHKRLPPVHCLKTVNAPFACGQGTGRLVHLDTDGITSLAVELAVVLQPANIRVVALIPKTRAVDASVEAPLDSYVINTVKDLASSWNAIEVFLRDDGATCSATPTSKKTAAAKLPKAAATGPADFLAAAGLTTSISTLQLNLNLMSLHRCCCALPDFVTLSNCFASWWAQ
jgi:hypothetical protein